MVFETFKNKNNLSFFLDKNYTYALVGASNDKSKYGYKILKNLLDANFNVIPINLKEKEILGRKVFKSLRHVLDNYVLDKIDVVIFVVPPNITLDVLKEVKKAGITKVWMQPGSESKECVQFCLDNGIDCIHDMCIMVERVIL